MISLNPALFELHFVFSERRDDVIAFSLRPTASDLPGRFCAFLADNLNDPLRARVLVQEDSLLFQIPDLEASLRLPLPTAYSLDLLKLLGSDNMPRSLGICRDPLPCAFGHSVYVYDQTKSPSGRRMISFRTNSS